MITVSCECGERFQMPDQAAGQRTRCPACGQAVRVSRDEDASGEDYAGGGPKGTSGKAVTSMVLGFLALVTTILTGLPAIIVGVLGLRDINNSYGRLGGKGFAITGIVMGSVGSLLIFPVLLFVLMFPAVSKVRSAANRLKSQNNLKMIGLAMHNFHNEHGFFPPPVVYDAQGKPLHSWRVLLLPYMGDPECQDVYNQLQLNEPWDSPRNRALLSRMPRVYKHPSVGTEPGDSTTVYQLFVGRGALFETDPLGGQPRALPNPPYPPGLFARGLLSRLTDITDGTGDTVMAVEAANAVPWTKPDDLAFAPDRPLPPLGVAELPETNILFADGSVRSIPKRVAEPILRAAITRNGGEVVALP